MHWIEKVVEELENYIATTKNKTKQDTIIINGGLSVSGLQHIGRLRGEIIVSETVRKLLERKGYRVKQYLVLYTQDAWKGKESQVMSFGDEREGRKYAGWPLIRVPDPKKCHANWVEHYWEDFGGYLDKFTDGKIEVVTTTELYKTKLKDIVKEAINKKEKLRLTINKYRGRNPYPEEWIPFEPICDKCGRIDKAKAIKYYSETEEVEYTCENCGRRGKTSIANGKLNWRVEWASIWKALNIDFEPFGKDHATPGGSRDSCVDLSINVFETKPPMGLAYEWVSLRVNGKEFDMGSSDFLGITPKDWYQVAHPEVLRYLYLKEHPRRKVVIDMTLIPNYYEEFYRAESLYYDAMKTHGNLESLPENEYEIAKTYELSMLEPIPSEKPLQPSYLTIALAVQLVPPDNLAENVVKRLKSSRIIPQQLRPFDKKRITDIAWRTKNWVEKYASPQIRFTLLQQLSEELKAKLMYRDLLLRLGEELLKLGENWSEESIKDVMIKVTQGLKDDEKKAFYKEFYMIIIGKEFGPRAAPLIEILGQDFVKKRFIEDLS
jgi:lysyl-tRNA synthetase class 1